MTINRAEAPQFYPIQGFDLISPEETTYPNGLKSFSFKGGDQDLVRIEWIFENIMGEDEDTLLHSCLPPMLLEGTERLSNADIADFVDFHGAYLVPEFHSDYSSLTLFSLSKHLPKLLPVVKQLLTSATFPEKEWNTYIRNRRQRLEISLRKNDILARRTFHDQIFGQTRYGISPDPESFDKLSLSDLRQIYERQFVPANCTLIIAGKVNQETQDLLQLSFGEEWNKTSAALAKTGPVFPINEGETYLTTIPDSIQSAVRLGNRSIQRSHPDFPGLQFVNTLLGGYFGSRLMMNIREDKGYTYGIGCGLAVLKHGAYFTISTEVGIDFTRPTLIEIEKEIHRLHVEDVPEEEMELVRNFLTGSLLGSLENIFSHADKFKQAYFSGVTLDYFDYYHSEMLRMTPERVKQLALQYLDYYKMEKIIVGQMPA